MSSLFFIIIFSLFPLVVVEILKDIFRFAFLVPPGLLFVLYIIGFVFCARLNHSGRVIRPALGILSSLLFSGQFFFLFLSLLFLLIALVCLFLLLFVGGRTSRRVEAKGGFDRSVGACAISCEEGREGAKRAKAKE